MPTLHCDGDDGDCGAWDIDDYALDSTSVDGVRITTTERAPGWVSTETADYCPDHVG